ncbi:MAG: hypothetical protein R3C03_12285 [Pirellulaceae bacterium]
MFSDSRTLMMCMASFTYSKGSSVIHVYIYKKDGDGSAKAGKLLPISAELVRVKPTTADATRNLSCSLSIRKTGRPQVMLENDELSVAMFSGIDIFVKDGETEYKSYLPPHERHDH